MYPKIMSSAKSTKFSPATAGTHVAILTTIVDVGLQDGSFGPKAQLYLSFEITDEFNEWADASGRRREPKRVAGFVTNSMSEKARLRVYVEGILGSRLSDAQLRGCNVVDLVLGKPCLLHVVHNEANGNNYANIGSVAPLPKTMQAPEHSMELVVYSPNDHDQAVWEKLPKFLQEKIAKRVASEPESLVAEPAKEPGSEVSFNDAIPF